MFEDQLYQQRCTDCGALSPAISDGDTFLSTRYGWRLHRFSNERGELSFEWRCPTCWARFKGGRTTAAMPAIPPPAEPPPSSSVRGRPPADGARPGVFSQVLERLKPDKGR